MCDPSAIRNWLIAAMILLAVAIGCLLAAAFTNGSFFFAWMSPGWMLAAGGAAGASSAACGFAKGALEAYCECLRGRCPGECSNLRTALYTSLTALGILSGTCFVIAAYAWVPGVPQPEMWYVIGELGVIAVLLGNTLVMWARLLACASR